MIAGARDAVFPALVHIEVQAVEHWAGQESKITSTGSGTIIDPSGLVLTNAHVTDKGRRFFCTLADKQRVVATLIGEDPWTDLALLQLDASSVRGYANGLPHASFGDSSHLRTGDLVLAMGSPFALDRTVTLGIVANPDRVFTGGPSNDVEDLQLGWGSQRTGIFTSWIQHDALINPGNSGGPLVSMDGQIIGINTRGGSGNGFATPSNIARDVVEQLRMHGQVNRSWIGVGLKHLERTGLDRGVFIDSVDADGPAFEAGLRAGDVLITIDGKPQTVRFPEEVPDLLALIASYPVGQTLHVEYERKGVPGSTSIMTRRLELDEGEKVSLRKWGLTVNQITPYEAAWRMLPSTDGAMVESTRSGMPAQLAEPPLQSGDVIRAIDGKVVQSIRDLVDIYSQLDSDPNRPAYVLVEFSRGDSQLITALRTSMPDSADPPRDLPRAWLGIDTQPVVPDLARHLPSPDHLGFRITRIYPGTTAAEADLRVGEIITQINGVAVQPSAIEQAGMFGREIRRLDVGSNAILSVVRDGQTVDVAVKLERSRTRPEEAKREKNRDFGLTVRAITFFDRIDNRWTDEVRGVIVDDVERGGWAASAGILAGDLVQQIDEHEVHNLTDYNAAMKSVAEARPERVVIRVLRGPRTSFRFVEPEWTPVLEANPASGEPTE
ncbi:MAG: PDZ domain-containing protein [Phycisphaerales bacterium]|nr:PDZ domain-containing protein [Phycisphaerales bacterium]